MPIWINALGIGCIGASLGYILLFALKRYLPPLTPLAQQSPTLKDVLLFLVSLSMPGLVGLSASITAITAVDGINYIGAYGIGLFFGLTANVAVSLHLMKAT